MFILNSMLLFICVIYGWVIAKIFGRENFNNIWLWTSFILFLINHTVMSGKLHFSDDEEDE